MSNPRFYETRPPAKLTRRMIGRASRTTALLTLFLILLATTLYSGSSASSSLAALNSRGSESTTRGEDKLATGSKGELRGNEVGSTASLAPALLMPLMPPEDLYGPETVTTYAADCTTPKSAFNFGDMVCAKIEGGPPIEVAPRRFAWVSRDNVVQSRTTVTILGQTDLFQLPPVDLNNDLRGGWRVNSISPRSSVRASAEFTVSDPANAAANLTIYNNLNTNPSGFSAGSNVEFVLWIVNRGPDNAANVQIAIAATNSTFDSYTVVGEAFTCLSSGATCSIPSLPAGTKTAIRLVYDTAANAPVGTVVTNTATITSDTNDARPSDNSSTAKLEITVEADEGVCTLDCPDNITKAADATQEGISGAFVTLPSADVSGNCGSVTSSHASGSFFPVGSTTVTISSTSGESCNYVVNVIDTAPPTITCPDDLTVTSCAAVNPGTPSATGTGVTVQGIRSDGRALTDPYPNGDTTITWTATDSSGRTATCDQRISREVNDTTAPAPDLNALPTITSACTATADVPTATDDCSGRIGATTSDPRTYDSPGTYIIHWTYTDAAGNSSTQDQTVIVTDDTTAPTITHCASNVTITADASCATMPDLTGEIEATDNCSTLTVTQSPAPDTTLSSGNTPVTFTVTDNAGNTATCSVIVTVVDNIAPTVTAPADSSAGADASCQAAVPNYAAASTSSDNCGTPTVTQSPATGTLVGLGPHTVTVTVTDAAGNQSSDDVIFTVNDVTAPTVTAPADSSASADATCQAQIPNYAAASSTSDNCDSSVTVTQSPATGTVVGLGSHTVTVTATDDAGNSSADTVIFTVNDTTAPAISCPANIVVYLPLNSTATSMAVSYPAVTATDNCSTPTVTSLPASGSVFPVGATTVNATATDAAGNSSSCSFTVTVLYNFTGFFSPVSNLPTLNLVNAGRAIPVKFSLSGNKGLDIFAANSPYTVAINCDGTAPSAEVTETLTAGESSLNYSPDQYNYVWKTENSWVGTCRQLVVELNDGSEHRANFKFR